MAKKKSTQDLYTGRSGQLAVMAEFLYRRRNVAVPEVDVGDDVFVVRDKDDVITRVQVKSANARQTQVGFFAQFKLPLEQLAKEDPRLVYVFAVRHEDRWAEFLLIHRSVLYDLRIQNLIGSPDGSGNLVLRLAFTATDVQNKGTSFQPYRNAWEPWAPLPSP